MPNTETICRLQGITHATITLEIEQAGDLLRVVWETDKFEDAPSMLSDVLDHIADVGSNMPKSIKRFAPYSAYRDLAEGAGLYE